MSSSNHRSSDASPRAIEEAAAWRVRHRHGVLPDAENASFQRWLAASPDNVRAWHSQEQLWKRLGEAHDAPAILALRATARQSGGAHWLQRRTWQWGSALAASLVVGIGVWQWQPLTPDVLRVQASSALLIPDAAHLKPLARLEDVATRVGERALVQLADGSTVTLNTDSAIHVDLTGPNRSITLLRGEAYFEVAKDKDRPFIVSAGAHQVIAVGTAFDVRLHAQQLKVNLVEGKVRVERIENAAAPVSSAVTLDAGSSLVAGADGQQHIKPLNRHREVSWRAGKLVFAGDRLADVVTEMNLYSSQKLEIRDAEINDRLLSGVFSPAGGAELARALESYGMVRIVSQNDSAIVLGSP